MTERKFEQHQRVLVSRGGTMERGEVVDIRTDYFGKPRYDVKLDGHWQTTYSIAENQLVAEDPAAIEEHEDWEDGPQTMVDEVEGV